MDMAIVLNSELISSVEIFIPGSQGSVGEMLTACVPSMFHDKVFESTLTLSQDQEMSIEFLCCMY